MSTDELSDVDFLLAGELTVLGRMPHSSNATLLCSITAILYSSSGPVVLGVNLTGGSLKDLRPS